MEKLLKLFFFVMVVSQTFAQEQPTANQIIDKYVTAIGGKPAIDAIKDITLAYTSESPRGVAETEIKYLFPNKFAMGIYANGNAIMNTACDGIKLKRFSMWGGGGDQAPKEGPEVQFEALRANPFAEVSYATNNIKAELQGTEKVGDKDAYKVQLSNAEGKNWFDYFDVDSGLKVKTFSSMETPRGKMENTVLYEEYKKFKGVDVLFPAVTKRTTQMGEISSELQSVKINKNLSDKDFIVK